MVLGKSIYSASGDLLLAAGYNLNQAVITRLKMLGFSGIWVQHEGTEHIIPPQVLNDQVLLQTNLALRQTADVIKSVVQTRVRTRENMGAMLKDKSRFHNVLISAAIQKTVGDIVESLLGNPDVLINANTIRGFDEYLFQHQLETTIVSVIMAKKIGYNRKELEILAAGCLLHDLGLSIIPADITHKSGRLTFDEFSLLKEHTSLGYAILKENPRLSIISAHIAFQHHERQDGGGYPRGLRGENEISTKHFHNERGHIHRYAEIVAVANTYENLIAPRGQPQLAKSPPEALKTMILAAGTQLNRALVNLFLSLTPAYPVGSFVTVMGESKEYVGYKGVVSKLIPSNLARPEILLLFNREGKRIRPVALNLTEQPDIHIQFNMLKDSGNRG
jgi:HD-GYP domain-containing protein (c-di-GMP phosphodiesterase class II)